MDSDFDTTVNTLDERLKDLSLDIRRLTMVLAVLAASQRWQMNFKATIGTAKDIVEEAEEWIVE